MRTAKGEVIGDTSWQNDVKFWMDTVHACRVIIGIHLQQGMARQLHRAMHEPKSLYSIQFELSNTHIHALHINQKSLLFFIRSTDANISHYISHSFLFSSFNYITLEIATMPEPLNDVKEESKNPNYGTSGIEEQFAEGK